MINNKSVIKSLQYRLLQRLTICFNQNKTLIEKKMIKVCKRQSSLYKSDKKYIIVCSFLFKLYGRKDKNKNKTK